MTLDLRHLRHVTVLAEAGNFSRAAEIIGITQPALSRSVAGLEAGLGFALFDRTPAGVIPTTMGAVFLKDARKLLLQASQLETDARALAAGDGGSLSFGLGPLLSSLILPDLLVLLANRFARLQVRPMTASAVDMMTALSERRIEMCLLAEGPISTAGVVIQPVGSIAIALLVRSGHPLAGRRALRLQDLLEYPLATGSYDGRPINGLEPQSTIICENFHILRETVLRSDAIWLSSSALMPPDTEPALVELDVVDFPTRRCEVLLARTEHRTPSRAGREVEAAIRSLLAGIR
ncbi:LysR family transcriptional regulator [Rhizobium sp. CRIBSB]|nr:LysR family transcriptional regulator [Rhizobium sp. CRIBSB]